MNNQEVFDKAWNWLARPNASKCVNDQGMCVYLREDGNRCGIGGVMSDKLLQTPVNQFSDYGPGVIPISVPIAEYGASITSLLEESEATRKYFQGCDRDLLFGIQDAHDDPGAGADWQDKALEEMRWVARNFELRVPE